MGNITKDLGAVSAYALAVEKGYTGTEEEFAVLLATSAQNAQNAATSAEEAKASAESAARSEANVHDYIKDINDTGAAQMAAIEQKGAATLETIPEDYTALANDVSSLKDHIGDLKSAITTVEKNASDYFSYTASAYSVGYIDVSGGVGTTIDFSNVVSNGQYRYIIIPCTKGDVFTVTGKGAGAPRAWCFLDSAKKITSVSASGITVTDLELRADADGYFIAQSENAKTHYVNFRHFSELMTVNSYKARNLIIPTWEHGSVSNSGQNVERNYQMRTHSVYHVKAGSKITKSTTFALELIFYKGYDFSTYDSYTQITAATAEYTFTNDCYVRLHTQNTSSVNVSVNWANANIKTELIPADDFAEVGVDISALGYSSYLGNATLIQFPTGKTMLVDTFIVDAWESLYDDLKSRGVYHLDYLHLTHYHSDHVGNVSNLVTNGYIDSETTVYLPQNLDTSYQTAITPDWLDDDGPVAMYEEVIAALTEANCTIVYPTEGQVFNIEGFDYKFWNADHSVFYPNGAYASSNFNDFSLGAYLFVGDKNICFTGDLGYIGQTKMVDLGTMVKANLYTATHHGWDHGTASNYFGLSPAWINRLNPDIVISEDYSAHNSLILTPYAPMQSWCEKNSVPNYRTAINGSMDIHLDCHEWKFKGAYSKYIRAYNWGFDYEKNILRAKIDATSANLVKPKFSDSNTATLYYRAITAMLGASSYTEGYKYTFYVRAYDSGNSSAFLEMTVTDFIFNSANGTYETLFSKDIYCNTYNNKGSIEISGLIGTPTVVVEIVEYSATT